MGKPLLETIHTESVLQKLLKEVTNTANIARITSMVIFSGYYAYLIATNIHSIPHLIAYIALFCIVIITFFAGSTFKTKKLDSRKDKRKKLEKKRTFKLVISVIKYAAKGITCVLALHASITNPASSWDLILDVVSGVMLLVTVLFELVTAIINKYYDLFTISLMLDKQNSGGFVLYRDVAKLLGNKQYKLDDMIDDELIDKGESLYTPQEQKLIDSITTDADALRVKKKQQKAEKKALIDEKYSETKAKRKQAKKDKVAASKADKKRKLTKAEKKTVTQKYEEKKAQASQIISLPEKLDELFDKGQMLFDNLPVEIPALKNIPLFLSLINNYASGRYKDISVTSIVAVVAAVLYFVAPIDVVPEATIPGIGYVDDAFVVDMVLKVVKKELKKFEEWKKNTTTTNSNLPVKK